MVHAQMGGWRARTFRGVCVRGAFVERTMTGKSRWYIYIYSERPVVRGSKWYECLVLNGLLRFWCGRVTALGGNSSPCHTMSLGNSWGGIVPALSEATKGTRAGCHCNKLIGLRVPQPVNAALSAVLRNYWIVSAMYVCSVCLWSILVPLLSSTRAYQNYRAVVFDGRLEIRKPANQACALPSDSG